MKQLRNIFSMLLLFVLVGCAHFPTVNKTVVVDVVFKRAEVLEMAVDVAKSMNFPEVTKFDASNGIVEFGAFGRSVTGLTAQVRMRTDNKNVDITIKRGSVYVPLPVEETANEFTNKFQERLKEKQKNK